ncbi:hypothetical protein P7K49_034552 [Saguinus oedipus]|uniref:Ig-like domain-containing protein n=1 Tax=Saguinus oedipus TaxID=9490 RepID=A0ABQ9TVW9_SAGOE|nr:hypothetical protein P7K49_034552 [Saguinus oedipus]
MEPPDAPAWACGALLLAVLLAAHPGMVQAESKVGLGGGPWRPQESKEKGLYADSRKQNVGTPRRRDTGVLEGSPHCPLADAQAEVHLSVPPLVEVMRGEPVTLDCTPTGTQDHYVLEWFLTDRSGARPRLASAEMQGQGSELQVTVHDSRGRSPPYQLDPWGRLVLAEAQVGDERDYMCVVRAGAAGTAEATARLSVFGPRLCLPQIATCHSRNGNPAPKITWYRNGQPLAVPVEMNPEGYMTSRTVREASGLLSLMSTLYLRLRKADRDASFHCAAHYSLPEGRHGRLDSRTFQLTLHYPTEHVQFWVGSPSTPAGWVREGDTVQLLCRGDGSPSPEYTLFRLQDKQEEVLNVNLEGNLTLEGVTRGQSGTYGCRVEDYDAAEDVQLSKTLELRVACESPGGRGRHEGASAPSCPQP